MLKTVSTQLALASDTLSEILAKGNTSGASNISMDSGFGVLLGGTAAENLLDDYVEGVFTPTSNSGVAFTAATGSYVKVGNLVHFSATFVVQNNFSGADFGLNLPAFTPYNDNGNRAGVSIAYHGTSFAGMTSRIDLAGSSIVFYNGATAITNTQLATAEIYIGGTYRSV
jgi:hypothetical protein